MAKKPTVFIHTNDKQYVGALVSLHSMRRNSASPEKFDVQLIELKDHMDFFGPYEGRQYMRDGDSRTWLNDDLQSFTPLRFMPPQLMGRLIRPPQPLCGPAGETARQDVVLPRRATAARRDSPRPPGPAPPAECASKADRSGAQR